MIRNTILMAVFTAAVWAHAPATLKGQFLLAEEGANSSALGILTFDGAGKVSGIEYLQVPGQTQAVPVTGTYSIAADGSGTLTLNRQEVTEDGAAPAVAAIYDLLATNDGGFAAIRRDSAEANLAEIVPASLATSYKGAFLLSDEGESSSRQPVAQIGVLMLKGDGTLSGKLIVKQNGKAESKAASGSYVIDSTGLGNLRLMTPSAPDEDGGVVMVPTPYVFVVTAHKEIIAMATDNSLLGLVHISAQ